MKRIILNTLLIYLISSALFQGVIYSQTAKISLSGTITNGFTKKPADFATVAIAELQIKTRSDEEGKYSLQIPQPGTYTVIVSSAGLNPLTETIDVKNSIVRDFILNPARIRGAGLTITGEKDVQKVSRYTMTPREMKEVPASFGDSISALTALPGVIRTSGFFGPLVIRGADSNSNRYYIDDIPIYNPQHFFAIQSVISSDLMSEIDLYASAFPAQFGNANGAIININTIDEVKQPGGTVEIGLISSNVFLKMPLEREITDRENPENPHKIKESAGYVIAAGRYGYLSLFIPPIYKLITGEKLSSVPEYYDYQFKGKYFFDSSNSVTILFMGTKDFINFIQDKKTPDEVDPLLEKWQLENDLTSNSVGFYYDYQPSSKFKNTILAYGSFNDSYLYLNIDNNSAASWVKGLNVTSKTYTYGLKEKVKWEWWRDTAEVRASVETVLYDFTVDGYTLVPLKPPLSIPDFSDEEAYRADPNTESVKNVSVGGYLENKFTFGNITFTPGVRTDYLKRSSITTVDPRAMISYEFPTDTTVSAAGGRYSSFYQTNPYIFNLTPKFTSLGSELKPERAWHRSLGIEQKVSLFVIKIEGFYNTFYDLAETQGNLPNGIANTGEQKAYGAELMLRLDRVENQNGLFGWVNYTYTQSKRKSGLPLSLDPYGDQYLNFNNEQEHALKIVSGYVFRRHTLSGRFQANSSFPYTPITGSELSPDPTPSGSEPRYARTFYGSKPYSAHFPIDHRLDVRYSYKTNKTWGSISWYIEVINIYNNKTVSRETWNYSKPYGPDNPTKEPDDGLSIIPNFGVEIKF
jgi:hypothetical protein